MVANGWQKVSKTKVNGGRAGERAEQIQDHRSFSSQTSDFQQKHTEQQYKLREVETAIEKNSFH